LLLQLPGCLSQLLLRSPLCRYYVTSRPQIAPPSAAVALLLLQLRLLPLLSLLLVLLLLLPPPCCCPCCCAPYAAAQSCSTLPRLLLLPLLLLPLLWLPLLLLLLLLRAPPPLPPVSPDVDVSRSCPHAHSRNEAALHQLVWLVPHDLPVLARTRLTLISIHNKVVGTAIRHLGGRGGWGGGTAGTRGEGGEGTMRVSVADRGGL